MGGMNQNRFGTTATSHYSAPNSQSGMAFQSLPEYQCPAKRTSHQQGSTAPHQLRPRQHIVPAAPQQQQYPVGSQQPQQSMIDSPTLSQGSDKGSNNSQQPCFHYNPYDTQCSRVTYQQQLMQQQQQYNQAQFPAVQDDSRNSSMGYDSSAQYYEEERMEEAPAKSTLPYGTLHGHLEGYVSFVPYPTEEFRNPNKGVQVPSEGNMSRVFLGQLPYQVTDMQLEWLCFTFGNGGAVHFPERITKHDPMRGCKVPTGCIHAYADNDCVTPMLNPCTRGSSLMTQVCGTLRAPSSSPSSTTTVS